MNPTINEVSPQLFAKAGVYPLIVPGGVFFMRATGIAGGGGAGGSNAITYVGGKGGQSEMANDVPIKVTPYQTLTITVGAGGVGGALNAAGNNGGGTKMVDANGNDLFTVQGGGGGGAATGAANGAAGANYIFNDSASQGVYGIGAPTPAIDAVGANGLDGVLSLSW